MENSNTWVNYQATTDGLPQSLQETPKKKMKIMKFYYQDQEITP